MGYKLIFSDLDGTLLNDNYEVTRENLEALEELTARGVRLVPASGRCLNEIPEVIRKHPRICEVITSNGAYTADNATGAPRVRLSISRKAMDILEELRHEYGALECLHENGRTHASREQMERHLEMGMNEYYYGAIGPHATTHEDYDSFRRGLAEADMCAWFFADTDALKECWGRLEATDCFSLTATAATTLEIIAKGVSKGAALTRVAEQYGVPLSETIAIGDSRNDASMLEVAGLGLAVANAAEPAKAAADRVVCHHNDPILRYILEHFC